MAKTVAEFCNLLARSRLHAPDAVKIIHQRWLAAAIDPGSVAAFSGWLVARQYLTEYQAGLLGQGRADNFFLGPYKVLERIGKGRMAGVWKGQHPQGTAVALKVLPPSKAKDPATLGRFQREARLAVQLNHPGVVRAYEYGETRGLHYLVMEYLEGESLEDVLRQRGKLPPKEAARLVFLALLGLQHIHEKGLVHRDLKPGNLMLVPPPGPFENTLRSTVKVLDIGLGRELYDPESLEPTAELTNEGALLGTPDYLAPEQARSASRADIRADVYSLGCLLYEAVAGQTPFKDDNPVRQILRHATQPPRPLQEVNPAVPADLEEVVLTMLAKDPAQRYQTPSEAAQALKEFLASPRRPGPGR